MARDEWFESKWRWLKRFAIAGGVGAVLLAVGLVSEVQALVVIGFLPLFPLVFWLALIPVLHWKDRYVGQRSGLWGALLVFETTSWSKLYYWGRHVLADWHRTRPVQRCPLADHSSRRRFAAHPETGVTGVFSLQ